MASASVPASPLSSLPGNQVAGLARTKLEALVRPFVEAPAGRAESFNAGVGLIDDGRAFVYLFGAAPSPMAALLAWGSRRGAAEFHVLVDEPDALTAAQARGLRAETKMWLVDGTALVPMPDVGLEPPPAVPEVALAEAAALIDAGCEVVVEHGVVIGEIAGLEVARVVIEADGRALIRVGVGVYDQEAHAVIHAGVPVDARLDQVIAAVAAQRNGDVGPHPLNSMARERWLRSIAVGEPSLVGLDVLAPTDPLTPRTGIYEARPAAAVGSGPGGRALVVSSIGIDLDLVPTAAGHLGTEPADEVVLLLPARDHHRVLDEMAAHLAAPVRFVSIDDPWPF